MPGKKPTYTGRDATKEATGIKHEISIHAPHTGRDQTPHMDGKPSVVFQSTRPIRGATLDDLLPIVSSFISIHAPHTGRDRTERGEGDGYRAFQSTRPIRGATLEG